MNQRILYNFASRSRPDKFFACLDNIRELSASKNYLVIAKLDNNDPSDYSRLYKYPEVVRASGLSRNKVDAINRGMLNHYEWDILCNHSDDMWFIEKDFDNIIRSEFNQPDLFVHFPDQAAGDKLCTYSMMDRVYYERTNYVYNPQYISLWCDNEAQEVAKILGRYKYADRKILEHRHPAWGLAPTDAQYQRTEKFYHLDKRTYDLRKRKNFGV